MFSSFREKINIFLNKNQNNLPIERLSTNKQNRKRENNKIKTNKLKTMWSLIEYLKRPELVVATQEWFGVQYLDKNETCDHDLHLTDCSKIIDNDDSLTKAHSHENKTRHRRNISNESDESSGTSSSADNNGTEGFHGDDIDDDNNKDEQQHQKQSDKCARNYRINNKFWYYLFLIGTELGDEFFYATMIPFWFWNIDGAVGRRVVFVWSIVMYIGQGLKDIIRWPRPGYPVQRLASKWSIEYGMPSTHAMVII